MTGKEAAAAITWRSRGPGGTPRAYLDERRWGGPRWAGLCAPGSNRAETDPARAAVLAEARIAELTGKRAAEQTRAAENARKAATLGLDATATFRDFALHHLECEQLDGGTSPAWLDALALMLERAGAFFCSYTRGEGEAARTYDGVQIQTATSAELRRRPGLHSPRNLATISTADCVAFVRWLSSAEGWEWERERRAAAGDRAPAGGKQGPFGAQHARHHLNAVSRLFRRAVTLGMVDVNPTREMLGRPVLPASTTKAMSVAEAALVIEAARTLNRRHAGPDALTCVHELVMFLLLTGCRMDEARLMEWRHVHFHTDSLEVPGTKTDESDRVIPLHAQLAETLLSYRQRTGQLSGPLFPSDRAPGHAFGDARKALNAVADRAGIPRAMLRSRPTRATYATHRVRSFDTDGSPMTAALVREEMGHTTESGVLEKRYVKKVLARLGRMRVFEFRIENHLTDPAVAAALERMAEMDAAAAVEAERTPAERQERDERAQQERADLLARFLAATAHLSTRAVERETSIAYRTIGRLRTGEYKGAVGTTLERMREYLHAQARQQQAA